LGLDLLVGIATAIKDGAVKLLAEAALRKTGDVVWGVLTHRKSHAEAVGDPDRLQAEISRLDETIASLHSEVQRLAGTHVNWKAIDLEASEPSFESFVEDALEMSASSPTESKRLMLGRMIVERLRVEADTSAEIHLRRAMSMLRDLTEDQLLLLASAVLVQYIPGEDKHIVSKDWSRDAAETWLRENYFEVVRRLKNAPYWQSDDFEALASVGAIRMDLQAQSSVLGRESHASSIEQWLYARGVSPYDGFEGELGSEASAKAYAKRFPMLAKLERLTAGGRASEGKPHMWSPRRLDEIVLTPIGEALGTFVLEQLTGDRYEKMVLMVRHPQPLDGK